MVACGAHGPFIGTNHYCLLVLVILPGMVCKDLCGFVVVPDMPFTFGCGLFTDYIVKPMVPGYRSASVDSAPFMDSAMMTSCLPVFGFVGFCFGFLCDYIASDLISCDGLVNGLTSWLSSSVSATVGYHELTCSSSFNISTMGARHAMVFSGLVCHRLLLPFFGRQTWWYGCWTWSLCWLSSFLQLLR